MKVFVTGGAGFIGSHVCKALVKTGHSVTVYDNLSTGSEDNIVEGVQFVEGDIRDYGATKMAMIDHDAVIHLAAQALVPESVENPQKSYEINVAGGYNVLVAMHEHGIKQLVYSSTAAVYGNQDKMPIKETAELKPVNPYGATKLALEELAHAYYSCYGINTTVFRYFNPFGPGENHDPETHAVPNFIKAILNDQPIPLFWNGEQIRDFFPVSDLADAHVTALGHKGFNTYNLGSGDGIKVRELVDLLFEVSGKKVKIENLGERPGDPQELRASVTKAKKEINWQPTELKKALKETWDYFSQL